MNHQQMIAEISKRLPRLKRPDVAEVLEVMGELVAQELAKPGGTVTIADLGKLMAEVQDFRCRGAVGRRLQHGTSRTLKRVYVRFRPTAKFRQAIIGQEIAEYEKEA
jgi:nucleoid DNA-binding protein